jgi:alkanesulfonate monooxygenase SsuD/methylene tetrahydromethanopterin reductase-like flavin-dependent oxidoreductase (luciferase family)
VLGLGAGWNEPEFRAFGLPFDHASRASRRRSPSSAAAGGRAGHAGGRFFQADDLVLLPRPADAAAARDRSNGPGCSRHAAPRGTRGTPGSTHTATRPKGFAELNGQSHGGTRGRRDPGEIERSLCVLVAVDDATGQRWWARTSSR